MVALAAQSAGLERLELCGDTMLDTRRATTGKVSIVGHRGATASAPENTMASFREGWQQGADIIELDVRRTADGYVVAFHDDMLDRTTDGHGPVAAHTLAELKRLDAGSWFDSRFAGEPIPTLAEVLAWARNRIPLFIELKYGGDSEEALEAAVMDQIVACAMLQQVMVISFNHQALQRLRVRALDLATGALYLAPVDAPVRMAQQVGATAVMPLWALITPEQVAACHAAKLSVNVWGAGLDYPAMIAVGVDCVNADHPERVRREFLQR
jgi:glycerophosphoryl diester phosphodiesterase